MARNNVNVCLTLPGEMLKRIDQKALSDERPRSFVVRKIIEQSFADSAARPRKSPQEPARGK